MTSSYFSYSKPKVLQALRFHFFNRNEIKAIIVVVNLFAIFSAVLYFKGMVSPVAFLMSSTLWFALMVTFWFILPFVIYRKAATFKDHFKVSLEEQHMFIENEHGSRSWPWKDFSSFVESANFFHLYFNSRSFFIIPKSAFAKEDWYEIRKLLKEKIKKQPPLKKKILG
ncbi:MAG: YcxB family protein [Ginsengibacter sp.]